MPTPIRATSTVAGTNVQKAAMELNYACEYDHVVRYTPGTTILEYEGPGNLTDSQPYRMVFGVLSLPQKGKIIHSGGIKALDAYILGSVPRQSFSQTPVETVPDARDGTLLNYQRPLTKKKRVNLTDWFGRAGMNFLATSPLLWLPELYRATTSIDKTAKINANYGVIHETSSIDGFAGVVNQITIPVVDVIFAPADSVCVKVKRSCDEGGHPRYELTNSNWFDFCPECGWSGKPGQIIDGQHRISGTGLSVASSEIIPCTFMLADDFNAVQKAKLFSEVTVEATSLHLLHAINLVYRSQPPRDHDKMKFSSEPQRMMLYETAITLTADTGPLQNRIMIVPNSKLAKVKGSMATIKQLVDWMFDSKLIDAITAVNPGAPPSVSMIAGLVSNWFEAIELSANAGWANGATWTRSRGGRGSSVGTLNKAPPTEVLIKILPFIIRHYGVSGIVSTTNFQIASNYISSIDLQDGSNFRQMTGGTGGQGNLTNLLYLLESMITDIEVSPSIRARSPPATQTSWIASGLTNPVDIFSVSIDSSFIVGNPISASNILRVSWSATSHDLVNTAPKGPLNSSLRKPKLKIYDGPTIYFEEELENKSMSKTFDNMLVAANGVPASPGTNLIFEVTYKHVVSLLGSRTETTTFRL